jgi:hypothetical protein
MAKAEKCKHEVCLCTVPEGGEFGDYCSAACQSAKDMTALRCHCGHDACMAKTVRQ